MRATVGLEPEINIRPANPADVETIAELIKDLAVYEEMQDVCVSSPDAIHQALFSPAPCAEVLIAELEDTTVGFALFFHNFSTFLGKRGLYVEDVFVRQNARGKGAGKLLLKSLARIAVERDCARMEWSVLDWNEPSIAFYKSLGAKPMDEWTGFRLQQQDIHELAGRR